jgi:hypothetical protein
MMNQNDIAQFTSAVTQKLYQVIVAQAQQLNFNQVQANILANQIVTPQKPLIQSKLATSTPAKVTAAMNVIVAGPIPYRTNQTKKFAKLSEMSKICLEAFFAKL